MGLTLKGVKGLAEADMSYQMLSQYSGREISLLYHS